MRKVALQAGEFGDPRVQVSARRLAAWRGRKRGDGFLVGATFGVRALQPPELPQSDAELHSGLGLARAGEPAQASREVRVVLFESAQPYRLVGPVQPRANASREVEVIGCVRFVDALRLFGFTQAIDRVLAD